MVRRINEVLRLGSRAAGLVRERGGAHTCRRSRGATALLALLVSRHALGMVLSSALLMRKNSTRPLTSTSEKGVPCGRLSIRRLAAAHGTLSRCATTEAASYVRRMTGSSAV